MAESLLEFGEGRPTLIVWGALDTLIPVSHAYAAHQAIPGSQLEIFEQSRHFPHMDEPARFARTVLGFLESTDGVAIDRAMLRDRIASGGPTARAPQQQAAPVAG